VAAGLVSTLTTEPNEGTRSMAAVMLRKLLDRGLGEGEGVWGSLPADVQGGVKDGLLVALKGETSKAVRSKLCHAIAEVAMVAGGPGCAQWQALLPTVFGLAQGPDAPTRATAVFLFNKLADYAGDTLLSPHAATLHALLPPLLADADNSVRISALRATIALLGALSNDAARAPFQALVPAMMKVGGCAVRGGPAAAPGVVVTRCWRAHCAHAYLPFLPLTVTCTFLRHLSPHLLSAAHYRCWRRRW
jgi:hypothetical protein